MVEPQPSTHTGWAEARERGSLWAMKVLFALYRWGGRFLALPIVYLVVLYFFITRRATRRYSRYYLRRVLGGNPSGWLVWRHHLAFARALMDRLGAWMGRIQRRHVNFPGRQTLLDLQHQGRGGVLLGAHFGNLEMCRAVVENDRQLKLNVILHTGNTENYNRLLSRASELSKVRLIQVADITPATAIMLRQKLDQGEFLILLADRLPPGNSQRFFSASMLASEARFPAGPFWLALMLGAPVFFIAGFATRAGYRVALEPLYSGGRVKRRERDTLCRQLLHDYIAKLQACCVKYPLQWFNFYDYWDDDNTRTVPDPNARKE